uniref:Protein-glutamine gamma-glutamyltransferase 2 n=1 Tax=Poecilia latipinna TaxID=48699 RepID=A0A3B3VAF8_9TELE
MARGLDPALFTGLDLHSETNNNKHRTNEISVKELIVRRGQAFQLTLRLAQPFRPAFDQLTMTVVTGELPSENLGTMSRFGVPDKVQRSGSAKAVWKAELQRSSSPETGVLALAIMPPAACPVGEYKMSAKLGGEERDLATLSVLFNPWCPEDWVFLPDEAERQEYVMNEHGIIYKGVDNYISPSHWDFGQFEEDMVKICMKVLDYNVKHKKDPADDVSARCNPIYVSRVVTSMINSENGGGILKGQWGMDFRGGVPPTHWSGSYAILKKWSNSVFSSVKYGQCWVYAGVMCSVMRLLGIPCRVVTNYQSAHDTNKNLTVDTYYADYGVREKESKDSIWNYHVWVEGWMRRPDLSKDGKYDGWQVLDPTPQEKSDGMFCCGPASVSAIRNGDTHLKYDVPFVFAEVNADCITWLVSGKTLTFSESFLSHISTKSVGTNDRMNITDSYKQKEGFYSFPSLFLMITAKQALVQMGYSIKLAESKCFFKFVKVSKPVDGEEVSLKLILNSDSSATRRLSINVAVQAMRFTGQPAGNILTQALERELVNRELTAEVLFQNPVKEILRDCSLTLTGSGLFIGELITRLPDLLPDNRVRVKFHFVPYKSGERTLIVDFDCASFRDIKQSCTVIVKP